MKRTSSIIACLMLIAIIAASGPTGIFQTARAQGDATGDSVAQDGFDSPVPAAAIVELEGEPVIRRERSVDPGAQRSRKMDFQSDRARAYEAQIEIEQDEFNRRALLLSPGLRIRDRLRKLANAVIVEARGDELAAIAALPGVKSVEPLKQYKMTLSDSVTLTGAPAFWDRLGGPQVAGEGIKIAIIDSGIDIANPLFSDIGYVAPPGFPRGAPAFTNNKVIVAKAFLPDNNTSPRDENGHGTHVAGIAAGNLNTRSPLAPLSGVAPHAYLGNYRVFGSSGSASDALIARALEEAVNDGFDVVNMSLGGDAESSLDFLGRAVETASASGMIVVVSAGNSGSEGEMSIGSPGVAPSAITVGATTNSHVVGPTVSVVGPEPVSSTLNGLASTKGSGGEPSASLNSPLGPMPYADVKDLDGQGRACAALPEGSLAGKIALIERGNCNFSDKINNAAAAGASAVIVFNQPFSENPESGGEQMVNMSVSGTAIPSVFVARSSGLALRDWLALHPNAQITLNSIGAGATAPDVIAGFSSRGPSSLQTLKPDLTAPGVSIYSGALATNFGSIADLSGFAAVNGTSQAAPHIAGAAALVKQLHPNWTPEQVKSALMSTADSSVFTVTGQVAGVLVAGAGRVDLARAAEVSATCSPASISFGIKKLKKKAKKNRFSADLNITSMLDGQNTFTVAIEQLDPGEGVTITCSAETVTLARGQTGMITVKVEAEKTAERRDYTGYVIIGNPAGESFRVPFWARYVKKRI